MRIVALGLGGAGCRIVDRLYAIDRSSSRVPCVDGLVVDVDEPTLRQLSAIPDAQKLYYPPFDPMNPDAPGQGEATATIDIAEIISRIHNFESGENDALFICCGLGGHMTDILPHIIAGLRSTLVEPIFGLVTLPCLAEGERRSAKAADDIDILSPLLDGMIVFDNETWYKKTRSAAQARPAKKDKGLAQMFGLGKPEVELSPEMATYLLLNEAIVRRISLILKAGEFRADGGIDLAEVVLDSGEVLNTMKDGGFIAIGYAVEHLPNNPLGFLSQLKPAGPFDEEGKKRASRIVELAKQAIYHEVSTPCDMTSAHKALILIAGPSHELSMQGFMTVRKWIDRSIRGLETRSGDYPVMNTKNVAIIVMLSGLENIPRISELREIREQLRTGPRPTAGSESERQLVTPIQESSGLLRDEMIVLPTKMQKETGGTWPGRERTSTPVPSQPVNSGESTHAPRPPRTHQPPPVQPARTIPPPFQQVPPREIPPEQTGPKVEPERPRAPHRHPDTIDKQERPAKRSVAQQPLSPTPAGAPPPTMRSVAGTQSQEQARQRIEQELQRQRMIALSGTQVKAAEGDTSSAKAPAAAIRTKRVVVSQAPADHQEPPARLSQEGILEASVKKTIIIRKRSSILETHETRSPVARNEFPDVRDKQETPSEKTTENAAMYEGNAEPVGVKEQEYRAKDTIFQGKRVSGSSVPKAKDNSLIHTSLKPKKPAGTSEPDDESSPDQKQGKKTKKQDEISWI